MNEEKVDIEGVLSEKGSYFSVKTTAHIHRLFEKFGFDEVFGRSAECADRAVLTGHNYVFAINQNIKYTFFLQKYK